MPERFLEYLVHEKRSSPHTVKSYRGDLCDLRDFLQAQYADDSIRDAPTDRLRSWLVHCMESGNAPATIQRKLSSLKSYFKWLKKYHGLKKDPTLKLVAPKTGISLPKFVDADTLDGAIPSRAGEASDKPGAAHIVDTLYRTGMRSAELIGLKIHDVDFGGKTIRVLGKRNKERIIPMSASLEHTLREYLQIRSELNPPTTVTAFFLTDKGRPLQPKYLYTLVNGFLATIGAGSAHGPHALRHSFATHLLNNGADINSIKELLGHTSLAATQVYTHVDITRLIEVHRKNHPRG